MTLMSARDILPCTLDLAACWKARKEAGRFVGSMPAVRYRFQETAPAPPVSPSQCQDNGTSEQHQESVEAVSSHSGQADFERSSRGIGHFVGDWETQETIVETPFKAKNEQIDRAVQNNDPIGRLLEYLSCKAKTHCKVVKFDEKNSTKTCSSCVHVGPLPPHHGERSNADAVALPYHATLMRR